VVPPQLDKLSHFSGTGKLPIPYPCNGGTRVAYYPFNIPLASPFCIFYRTGLTPVPSSLNVSNIRTLLAHRFHVLKLIVIIEEIISFVKNKLIYSSSPFLVTLYFIKERKTSQIIKILAFLSIYTF